MQENRLEDFQRTRYFSNDVTMNTLVGSILRAGRSLIDLDRTPIVKVGEGHRSIMAQDKVSQAIILKDLSNDHLHFLTEETSDDRRVVSHENPGDIFMGTAIVMDPLDGTTLYSSHLPEWCVGAALMQDGDIVGSVGYAPDANGGLLLYSHKETPVMLSERSDYPRCWAKKTASDQREWVILRGVDTELYTNITSIMPGIASRVRGVYVNGLGCLIGITQMILVIRYKRRH